MQINGEDVSAIVIQLKLFILHLLSYLIMLQLKFQLEYSYKMTYDAFKQYHCAVLSWKKISISGKLCHSWQAGLILTVSFKAMWLEKNSADVHICWRIWIWRLLHVLWIAN